MAPDAGGLNALFSMALGGLIGTTPHMIAASVMALARLLFEFAGAVAWLEMARMSEHQASAFHHSVLRPSCLN